MKKYVMFGQNQLFGDYASLIDALGGRLSRIVVNVPDPAPANLKSFADRVREYNAWLAAARGAPPVAVVELDGFTPSPEETALLGFRGSVGRPLRERLKAEFGIVFPPLLHPTAHVSPMAEIGEGTIIFSQADLGSFAKIGAFGIINRCGSLGHDTVAGDDVYVSPNATLGSNIRVGDCAVVGINATVIEGLTLGENCYVAGGAVVIRDVPPGALVAGVPAVVKKQRD